MKPHFLSFVLLVGLVPLGAAAQDNPISKSENLQGCLEGFAECDQGRLTVQERQVVQQSNTDRNYADCLSGLPYCDKSKLSAKQKQEVARADRDHNL